MAQSTTTANQEQPLTTIAKNPIHPDFNNIKKERLRQSYPHELHCPLDQNQ